MGRDHRVEVVVGHLPQHAVAQHARVGDENIEAAERGYGVFDQLLSGLGRPDGTDRCDRRTAALLDLGDGIVRGGCVDVVDDDCGARVGESYRVGTPEASTRARHDRDPAVEPDIGGGVHAAHR